MPKKKNLNFSKKSEEKKSSLSSFRKPIEY